MLPHDEVGGSVVGDVRDLVRAVRTAVPWPTVGVVDRRRTLWVWATEVVRIWPRESVTTTKSPPTTGRPR